MADAPSMHEVLGADTPKNWGKWGPEDQVGSLNYLTAEEVQRGLRAARQGKVFTLQVVMANPDGEPVWPGRRGAEKYMVLDEGDWRGEKGPQFPGGVHYADDFVTVYLQGSTQYDALGHLWYDGHIWNGYDATTTIGGLSKASVLPIAERGVVGRGVLVDMARHRSKPWLDKGETFTHEDVMAAAEAQGVTLDPRTILLIRTGFIEYFYTVTPSEFYDEFNEPGLTYSRELVQWFQEMEIPNLVTDTLANEVTYEPGSGVAVPLHCALMRNLGVTLTEICHLRHLAEDCAADGQWEFLYTAAPLKVYNGSGSPVNPVVIK